MTCIHKVVIIDFIDLSISITYVVNIAHKAVKIN